ncbi:hypothetical protein [Gemmatimonas sp.]
MLGHAVRRGRSRRLATWLGAFALGLVVAACGPGVRTNVANAMEGCLTVRNPPFKAGRFDEALAAKLPPAIDSLADKTAYSFGFIVYQETADAAETQAELTCALELGSHYEHEDVRAWLQYFSRSPNAPVAAHAKRLYEDQLARIGRSAASP